MQDGDWNDPATWDNGVPDSDTRAIISQGTTVELGGINHVAQEVVAQGTLKAEDRVLNAAGTAGNPTQVGEDKVRLYIDGALVDSTQGSQLWSHTDAIGIGGINGSTRTHTGTQSTSTSLSIGGGIDSVLNYGRALDASEVSDIYQNGRANVFLAPDDNLQAIWNFPNSSLDDNARNDSINDVGTFINGSPNTSRYYLELDGIDDQVNVATSVELNQGTFPEKTISLWFRADQTSGRQIIYEQGGSLRGLNIYLEGNTLYAGGWNRSENQSNWQGDWATYENVAPNQWHHVVLTIDGDASPLSAPLNGATKTLTTRWVHVNSGGSFEVGTAQDRFEDGRFELTLTGSDATSTQTVETAGGLMEIENNDGFLMTAGGGRLQFFGEDKVTYTKLAQTALKDESSIVVANVIERNFAEGNGTSASDDGILNWKKGDEIVIASSSHNYREEDVRTIEEITQNNDGTSTILLDAPLEYRHFSGIETYGNGSRTWEVDMRAEVGLLSRNVVVQGTQDTDVNFGDRELATYEDVNRPDFETEGTTNEIVQDVTNGVSAHTMIMPGSGQIIIDGVQFDRMGHAGRVGRYPIHWHLGGDRSGDRLSNSSVTNSNNRGVTIHGTQNLEIEGVLLHDIHGHGFFFEDGVEFGNKLTSNIAFGIHRVGRKLNSGNFNQDENYFDPFTVDLHDDLFVKSNRGVLSAAFWVTNPNNDFIGNVTAGSEGMGFWYVAAETPLGLSGKSGNYAGYQPFRQPMGRNENSTIHSTGTGFGVGEPGFNPAFFTEFDESVFNAQTDDLIAYKNHVGVWVESEVTFDEMKLADNHVGFRSFNELTIRDSLFVGDSRGNSVGNLDPYNRVGRQAIGVALAIYIEGTNVRDSHFAHFNRADQYFFNYQRQHNFNRFGSSFSGISFEDADGDGDTADDRDEQLKARPEFSTIDQLYSAGDDESYLYDIDGSLTGTSGATAVFNNRFMKSSDSIETTPNSNIFISSTAEYAKVTLSRVTGSSSSVTPVEALRPDGETSPIDSKSNWEQVIIINNDENSDGFDDETQLIFGPSLGNWDEGLNVRLTIDSDTGTPSDSSAVFALKGLPSGFTVLNAPLRGGINGVRNSNSSAYFIAANGDIWLKVFASDASAIQVRPS
ncbi:MAG: LamG-like jellyroll fold domain-containing protein [Planctomycetota bacterium]